MQASGFVCGTCRYIRMFAWRTKHVHGRKWRVLLEVSERLLYRDGRQSGALDVQYSNTTKLLCLTNPRGLSMCIPLSNNIQTQANGRTYVNITTHNAHCYYTV